MELHITNGSSGAGLIRDALGLDSRQLLTVNDLLCCGPLIPQQHFEDWIAMRQSYWNRLLNLCGMEETLMSEFPRDFYFNYHELEQADKVHIWLGTSLGDQLMLAFVASFFREQSLDYTKIHLHQFYRHKQKQFEIAGIGVLTPKELDQEQEVIQLTQPMANFLHECWNAATSATPHKLIDLLKQESVELPYTSRALGRFIFRYPDHQTGLSIWEERLLSYTKQFGPQANKVIGQILQDSFEELDLVGDLYLFALIKKLANPELNEPLLKLNAYDKEMKDTEVVLTETGESVLSAKKNMVELNGVARYVGGVSLSSEENQLWYRQDNHLEI